MEVILLEKIANLGNLGDRVTIKAGYGRNYLVPKGKAVLATEAKIAEFQARRAELEKAAADKLKEAQDRADALSKVAVEIAHKAGEEGKLFGSVGTHGIAEALTQAGVKVGKHEVRLPEGPIRQIGTYNIDINLHSDVVVTVLVNIIAEE